MFSPLCSVLFPSFFLIKGLELFRQVLVLLFTASRFRFHNAFGLRLLVCLENLTNLEQLSYSLHLWFELFGRTKMCLIPVRFIRSSCNRASSGFWRHFDGISRIICVTLQQILLRSRFLCTGLTAAAMGITSFCSSLRLFILRLKATVTAKVAVQD